MSLSSRCLFSKISLKDETHVWTGTLLTGCNCREFWILTTLEKEGIILIVKYEYGRQPCLEFYFREILF